MRDVVPRTMPFTLLREIIFGYRLLDGDCTLKDALVWRCRRRVQFGKERVQLARFVQLKQGLAHHAVEVRMPPLEFVDGEFHLFVL